MSFSSGSGPIATAFVDITADTRVAERQISNFIGRLDEVDEAARRIGESVENAFIEAARASDRALRDVGGGAFVPVVGEAEAASEAVNSSFRDAARDSDEALDNIGGVGTFAPVVVEAEFAGERIDNSFREAAVQSNLHLSTIALGIGALGAALAVGGAAIVGFGIQQAASLEQTQIGFKSLLGSAEEADAFIREMQEFAATTPFEFLGLANNVRSLLATGQALGITREELIPTITVIGDLTAVLGQPPESIDRVVRALGQMASRGKVTTEEMLQLTEALPGFQPFQAMAAGLGITTQELQEQVSAGLIPADVGVQALLQGMREFPGAAGAMAEQAQTLTGLFSTFKDTITLALTDAFQPLIPTIKTALADAVPVIETALNSIAPALSTIAGVVVTGLVDVIGALGPTLGVILQALGNGLAVLAEAAAPALAPLGEALASIAPLLFAIIDALSPLIGVFATFATTVVPPLAQVLTALVTNVLNPLVEIFSQTLVDALVAFQPVLTALADAFVTAFTILGPIIADVAEIFSDVLVDAFETLAPVLEDVIEIIGGTLAEVLTMLSPVIRDLAATFAERFQVTIEALAPVLPELAEALSQIALALAQLLVALLPLLIPLIELSTLFIQNIGAPVLLAVAQAIAFVATVVATLTNAFVTGLVPALITVRDFFVSLWQNVLVPIGDFLQAVFVPIFRTIATVAIAPVVLAVLAIIEVFKVYWENILVPLGQFIATVFNPILDALGAAFGFVAGIVSAVAQPAIDGFRLAVDAVGAAISFVRTAFIDPLIGVIRDSLTPVISGAQLAFDAMGTAIGAVGDVIDGLMDFVSDAIDLIGDLIDKIEDIPGASTVSSIVGKIPGLQRGGIINDDVVAQLHAPEVVIPLNDARRAMALARESGLLDLLGAHSRAGVSTLAGGVGLDGGAGAGLTIGTVNVSLERGTPAEAQTAANVFVDAVELTLRRRQLVMNVRTLGA